MAILPVIPPQAKILSAIETQVQLGFETEAGSITSLLNLTAGLVGSDAISFSATTGHNVQMDITGNKQFIRTSERGTVVTLNYLASSDSAIILKNFVASQENGLQGTLGGRISNNHAGDIELKGGVITEWPPFPSVGDGAVGDLSFQITFSYYRYAPPIRS